MILSWSFFCPNILMLFYMESLSWIPGQGILPKFTRTCTAWLSERQVRTRCWPWSAIYWMCCLMLVLFCPSTKRWQGDTDNDRMWFSKVNISYDCVSYVTFIIEDSGKFINKTKIVFLMPLLFETWANHGIHPFLFPLELCQIFRFSVHTESVDTYQNVKYEILFTC